MQHVSATYRVPGDHRDHGLRSAANLDLQIEDIQASDALVRNFVIADVAIVAADHLIAAGAEGEVALTGQDDDAHRVIVTRLVHGILQLEESLRTEGIALLGTADGDLGDALRLAGRHLVANIPVLACRAPLARRRGR